MADSVRLVVLWQRARSVSERGVAATLRQADEEGWMKWLGERGSLVRAAETVGSEQRFGWSGPDERGVH